MKWLWRAAAFLLFLAAGPVFVASCGSLSLTGDWRTADRASTGIAPPAAATPEAVVQVYSARAFAWRGIFGVHTWIATKAPEAGHYTVHQVMGWNARRNLPVVVSRPDVPDRSWYGNAPEILAELRGAAAAQAIPRVLDAVAEYPYTREYTLWPGPNSNTFTAYVARRVPALRAELPTTAIGKDYLAGGMPVGRAPSGTGYQLSVFGLLGVLVALDEGLEFNLLGLNFGVDPLGPALKLPGAERVGFDLDRRLEAAE